MERIPARPRQGHLRQAQPVDPHRPTRMAHRLVDTWPSNRRGAGSPSFPYVHEEHTPHADKLGAMRRRALSHPPPQDPHQDRRTHTAATQLAHAC